MYLSTSAGFGVAQATTPLRLSRMVRERVELTKRASFETFTIQNSASTLAEPPAAAVAANSFRLVRWALRHSNVMTVPLVPGPTGLTTRGSIRNVAMVLPLV